MTESQLECFCNERDIIRPITPISITNNFMAATNRWITGLGRELDVISWIATPPQQSSTARLLHHDTQRGLKDGSRSC